MISAELRQALEGVRVALPQDLDCSMMNSVYAANNRPVDGPVDYVDLLQVADGLICGQIVVYSAKFVGKAQINAEAQEGAPVQLGRDTWFCFGKVNEDPLFLNRADQSVWGFPDVGIVWSDSDRFEQFSENLDRFLLDHVFGDGYLSMAGVDADDQWWRLLRRLGRTS